MAIFKGTIGELSGKLGGNVFSHNAGGTYVRAHAVPINRNTARQQLARNALAWVAAQWAALTDNQRILWQQWSAAHPITDRLGNSVVMSGQGAFCQLNSRLRNLGIATRADPPPANLSANATITTVALTGPATAVVAFTTTPLPAGIRLELLMTPGTPAGRDPNIRGAKWAGVTAAAATSPVTIACATPFTSGAIVNTWLRVTDAYGQSSVPTKTRVTVG